MDMSYARVRRVGAWVAVALLATVVAGVTACGGSGGSSTPTPGGGASKAAAVSAGPITVVMKDNIFDPKELTVPVGKEVKITVKNTGTAVHNMQILSKEAEGKNFESAVMVNPGAEDTFEVKFKKAGTYKFQCIYHLPDMVGTITVQ